MCWMKFSDDSGCFFGGVFILQDPTDNHFDLSSRSSPQADVRVQPLYQDCLLCFWGAVRLNIMENELVELLKSKGTSRLQLLFLERAAKISNLTCWSSSVPGLRLCFIYSSLGRFPTNFMHLFIKCVVLSRISSQARQSLLLKLLVAPENDLLDVRRPLVFHIHICLARLVVD